MGPLSGWIFEKKTDLPVIGMKTGKNCFIKDRPKNYSKSFFIEKVNNETKMGIYIKDRLLKNAILLNVSWRSSAKELEVKIAPIWMHENCDSSFYVFNTCQVVQSRPNKYIWWQFLWKKKKALNFQKFRKNNWLKQIHNSFISLNVKPMRQHFQNFRKKQQKLVIIIWNSALGKVVNETSQNFVRWIYRSAKIGWIKNWIEHIPLPSLKCVGTIIAFVYRWNNNWNFPKILNEKIKILQDLTRILMCRSIGFKNFPTLKVLQLQKGSDST